MGIQIEQNIRNEMNASATGKSTEVDFLWNYFIFKKIKTQKYSIRYRSSSRCFFTIFGKFYG